MPLLAQAQACCYGGVAAEVCVRGLAMETSPACDRAMGAMITFPPRSLSSPASRKEDLPLPLALECPQHVLTLGPPQPPTPPHPPRGRAHPSLTAPSGPSPPAAPPLRSDPPLSSSPAVPTGGIHSGGGGGGMPRPLPGSPSCIEGCEWAFPPTLGCMAALMSIGKFAMLFLVYDVRFLYPSSFQRVRSRFLRGFVCPKGDCRLMMAVLNALCCSNIMNEPS